MEIPIKKNEEYIVEITDNGFTGEGITKVKDFTVFIPNAIKGEKIKILIVKVLSSYAFGKIIEILEKLDKSIDNFSEQFKFMKSEKKMVLEMFITAVVQSFAYYSITYMVYRAFGNYGISFWQIIPTQAFLLLIMTFIPTPGSGLGAEGGFYILFNTIFKEGTINMSILFWRLYTFYLPILVGLFFLIPTRSDRKEKTENTVKNK